MMARFRPLTAWAALAASLLVLPGAGTPALASTRTVTSLADSFAAGTLRSQINTAVAGDTINFQNGLTGTITLNGTELAIGQDLTIQGPGAAVITIAGNSATALNSRVINISSGTVAISGLTISGGNTSAYIGNASNGYVAPHDGNVGAGIRNAGTLTVSNCTFSGNTAFQIPDANGNGGTSGAGAGISNSGALTVNNCLFANNLTVSGGGINNSGTLTVSGSGFDSNNGGAGTSGGGGGIRNSGTLTLSGSTFFDNRSGNGGGISNSKTMTATNCTFTQNSGSGLYEGDSGSGGSGATVSNSSFIGNTTIGSGGAFSVHNGPLSFFNCTFSGNVASNSGNFQEFGGAGWNQGTLTLTNCTLSGNSAARGAGIYQPFVDDGNGGQISVGTLTLNNTLIAGNTLITTDYYSPAGPNVYGPVTAGDYNLVQDTSGTSLPGTHNLVGVDPKLGALSNNGGPTQTFALLAGSPAVDSGNSTLTTDQRGQARPFDRPAIANAVGSNGSDIGAFEDQTPLPTLTVNNPRSLPEGNVGSSGSVTFDIALSYASSQSITVNFQTRDGINNPAIAGTDYTAKAGKLTFSPGQTLKRVTIFFIGDSAVELNETFFFDLNTPTNATIADNRGVGAINNDDGPSITIADATIVDEGSSGTKPQTFIVTLSAASANTVTVSYATANGTANSDDYVATSGTLTFAPGETSKLINILVKGDTMVEPNETYKVILSKPTLAFVSDALAIGTIHNDDAAALLFNNDEPSQ